MLKKERELLVEAVVNGVVTLVLVAVVAYSVVMQVPIPAAIVRLVFLVLAARFGFSSWLDATIWNAVKQAREGRDGRGLSR